MTESDSTWNNHFLMFTCNSTNEQKCYHALFFLVTNTHNHVIQSRVSFDSSAPQTKRKNKPVFFKGWTSSFLLDMNSLDKFKINDA